MSLESGPKFEQKAASGQRVKLNCSTLQLQVNRRRERGGERWEVANQGEARPGGATPRRRRGRRARCRAWPSGTPPATAGHRAPPSEPLAPLGFGLRGAQYERAPPFSFEMGSRGTVVVARGIRRDSGVLV